MTEGSPDFSDEFKDLIPGYLKRRWQDLEVLRSSLASGDFGPMQNIGHQVRGNAGNLGFDELGLTGAEIELAAQEKNREKLTDLVEKFETQLKHLTQKNSE